MLAFQLEEVADKDPASFVQGVPRSALQLVAVACMLVAAKHEEVTHPNIEDFTDIAANCFQVCG